MSMKRWRVLYSLLLASILLGVSISVSDGGTLEISPDGIQVIQGQEDQGAVEIKEQKDVVDVGKKEQPAIAMTETEPDESDELDETDELSVAEGFGGCDNEFYWLQNRLLADFPLKPCPEFKSIEISTSNGERDVYAQYNVFMGIYEEYDLYKEYFEGKGYAFETERVRGQWGILQVKDEQIQMTVEVSAIEQDNFDTASVDLTYRESPARVHEVEESIINWDGKNGYGSCADEHYILTGQMMKDFPFEVCVDVSYLRVGFGETEQAVDAIYKAADSVEAVSERYTDFLRTQGYPAEIATDLADDADVVITANHGNVELLMKLVEMKDGESSIQLSYRGE